MKHYGIEVLGKFINEKEDVTSVTVEAGRQLYDNTRNAVYISTDEKWEAISNYLNKVNVKWYGALGDGLNDDTSYITSAMTDVVSGGTVSFSSGTYTVSASSGTIDLSSYEPVNLEFEPGAVIEILTGNTLILYSPDNIIANSKWNIFTGGGDIEFVTDKFVYGYSRKVSIQTANHIINGPWEGSTVFSNEGATGIINFTLPDAISGRSYSFYIITNQTLRMTPQATDNFRGYTDGLAVSTKTAGKYMQTAVVGTVCHIRCVIDGTWEYERRGSWTDEA